MPDLASPPSPSSLALAAAAAFVLPGRPTRAEPFGNGHIHRTFRVEAGPARFILQELNTAVFPDLEALLGNIAAVSAHLAGKAAARGADPARHVLSLVPTRAGGHLHRDDEDRSWRMYVCIEGARSHDQLRELDQAYQAARAFGRFQADLADYAGPRLAETLPGFHDTRRRLADFRAAVAADPLGRAAGAAAEIDGALAQAPLAELLLGLQAEGRLRERITHNDTKLNNVLLDDASGEAVCVLDLDTVMPGLALCDFGDLVRSACNPLVEDARDLQGFRIEPPVFAALARGYLEGCGGTLDALERSLLLEAGRVLSYECGLRFLADHLLGDRYFRIHRPGQNLDRARTQFAMVGALEAQRGELLHALGRD